MIYSILGIEFVNKHKTNYLNSMKKLFLTALLVLGAFTTYSCSSNKSVYQETTEVVTENFQSGYFDMHIKGNEYEVTYRGLNMNQSKVFDLSMLRASEIAKNKGFKHFVVLSNIIDKSILNNKKINSNTLKIALYNDVPGKYQTFYNAIEEYNRLAKKYNIK